MNKRLKALLLGSSLLLAGCNKKESLPVLDLLPLYLECLSVEDLYSYINGVKYDKKLGSFTIYLPSILESLDIVSIYVFSVVSESEYFPDPYLPPIREVYIKYQVTDENVNSVSTIFYAILEEDKVSINVVSKTPNVENYPRVLQMNTDFNSDASSNKSFFLYNANGEVGRTYISFKEDTPEDIKSSLRYEIGNSLGYSLVPYKI
jgi:hypothetical protein